MGQNFEIRSDTISGRYLRNGNPVSGLTVTLVQGGTTTSIDQEVTDRSGLWEFNNVQPGVYDIWFHEADATTGDWIYDILIVDSSNQIPLEFVLDPVLLVSEGTVRVDVNDAESSVALLSFSNLTPASGALGYIEVYYKESSEINYRLLSVFDVLAGIDNFLSESAISLTSKPSFYDFKARFFSDSRIPSKKNGVVFEAIHLNVQFDGIADLVDYVQVFGARMINGSSGESGSLVSNVARMRWDDLKVIDSGEFPKGSFDAFGDPVSVTEAQARTVGAYGVFMYVANQDGEYPEYMFPNPTDTEGTWEFKGETIFNTFETYVPWGKKVLFWIGFRSRKTISNVQTNETIY